MYYNEKDGSICNLLLSIAVYRLMLTSALGGNKHANGFQHIYVGYETTNVWP
jgi:hypothetical protein